MNNSPQTLNNWHRVVDSDGIVWLMLDTVGTTTNTLSSPILDELEQQITRLEHEPPQGLVIGSAKPGGFIAGADISEFTRLRDSQQAVELIQRGQSLMDRLEKLTCPTVAMIHGYCMGGGLELALACRYRIAEEGAHLALPEVRLGIFPGFGGTLRLPRLIGHLQALQMMLTGRSLDARRAKRLGLVDHVVPQRQLRRAARQQVLKAPAKREAPWLQQLPGWPPLRPLLATLLRRQLKRKANPKHYPAPYALLKHWSRHTSHSVILQGEAKSVATLITGSTARNLIRAFFLQERLKGEGNKSLFTPRHLHVIGAGVMGGDIAAWCALQGLQVTLQDRHPETLARAVKRAHGLFKKRLKKPRPIQAAMDRLIPDYEGHGLARADVVIEAIIENVEAKQLLFRSIEGRLKPGTVMATNTSSIPLETLAEALDDPARLVGLHFFNPVSRMQLVEVVRGDNSSDEMVACACAFTRHIDRLPLPVKSSPGFLVNRVLMPYLLEAVILESEGVPAAAIDRAALEFGMPMGPIHLADTVGLDICLSVAHILNDHLELEVPARLQQLVESGRLGIKSGEGFYRYQNNRPLKPRISGNADIPTDLTDRLMLRFLNEAIACLREEVVTDADLLDAGLIFGTGFAPFRGGPLHYLHQNDLSEQRHHLEELQHHYGHRFDLDDGWRLLGERS